VVAVPELRRRLPLGKLAAISKVKAPGAVGSERIVAS
jgi:hypothetical protein